VTAVCSVKKNWWVSVAYQLSALILGLSATAIFNQLSSGLLRAPLRCGRQKTGRLNPAYPAARQHLQLYSALPAQAGFWYGKHSLAGCEQYKLR